MIESNLIPPDISRHSLVEKELKNEAAFYSVSSFITPAFVFSVSMLGNTDSRGIFSTVSTAG
tara:strand:- start:141259 stop:141444 length:186 start_codon:yes stop_codon:yes gene_type:complete